MKFVLVGGCWAPDVGVRGGPLDGDGAADGARRAGRWDS